MIKASYRPLQTYSSKMTTWHSFPLLGSMLKLLAVKLQKTAASTLALLMLRGVKDRAQVKAGALSKCRPPVRLPL
jgi:hypothetical protein